MMPISPLGQHELMSGLICRVVVADDVDPRFCESLGRFITTPLREGTLIEGVVADQSELAGVFDRLFGMGITVVSFTTESEIEGTQSPG
jgi:hypothetical protein